MGEIYKITNTVNGKMYVGKTTVGIKLRFARHRNESKRNRRYRCALYDAFDKYGIENFAIETIEECDNSILDARERYWIKTLGTMGNGYNITVGGDGHNMICDEDKQNVIDLWEQGLTEVEICKQVAICGKTVRRIIREVGVEEKEVRTRGAKSHAPVKPLYVYDLDGNFMCEYPSVKEASKALKIHNTTIGHACDEKRTDVQQVHGMMFRYFKAEKIEPLGRPVPKPVEVHQYTLGGDYVASYPTMKSAMEAVGLKDCHGIRNVCNGTNNYSGGFQWRYYKVNKIGKATSKFIKGESV